MPLPKWMIYTKKAKKTRRIIFQTLLFIFSWVRLNFAEPNLAWAKSCGKVIISSGEDCESLVVLFDLAGCQEGHEEKRATLTCTKESGTASVSTQKAQYKVKIEKFTGSLGKTIWIQAGELKKTSTSTPTQKNKKVSRSSRKPASQTLGTPPLIAPFPSPHPSVTPFIVPTPVVSIAPTETHHVEVLPESKPNTSNLVFSVNFDLYYSYNFNRPAPAVPTPATFFNTPNTLLRGYDTYSDQIILNLVEVSLKKTGEEVNFLVDLDFGAQPDYNAMIASSNGYTLDLASKNVGQAVLSYTPKSIPHLILEVGKMASHIGLEVIKSRDNWQYSRATGFTYSPFWHTGVHLGYSPIPNFLSTSVYLYNGSNNTMFDNNSGKTVGTQIKLTPSSDFNMAYNFIAGPEKYMSSDVRTIHEINFIYHMNPFVAFAGDFLIGRDSNQDSNMNQNAVHWASEAIYTKLQLSHSYYLSPRFEAFQDPDGFTLGVGSQTLYSYTLTNGLSLAEGLETKLEFRLDHSTLNTVFSTPNGPSANQLTSTLGILYNF